MHDHSQSPWWRTRGGIALIGFALVAAFYVLREHYAHALGALPYLERIPNRGQPGGGAVRQRSTSLPARRRARRR